MKIKEKEEDQAIPTFSNDIYKKIEQYRPSRALNSERFSYVWNGWSDGETNLPGTMGGNVSHLLKKFSKNQADKDYPNYKARAKFMKMKAPEELYDTSKDPGCLINLAKNPEYQTVIKSYRKKMLKLLEETKDHELENYKQSL